VKHKFMPQSLKLTILALSAVAALVAGCATPTPEVIEKVVTQVVKETVVQKEAVKETVIVEGTPQVVAKAVTATPAWVSDSGQTVPVAHHVNRMIIKNGELSLLVADTDRAVDQVTQIATDTLGYIITAHTWYQDGVKYATMTIGVPVAEFETALRRLRALAIKVLSENASGTDVTDQYVDLESRLRNLEATEIRLRALLDKAEKVGEALQVNLELAEITGQIEQVKGQMNYLSDRSAYSTITVHLSPDVPTPTPTPYVWQPGETAGNALSVLGDNLRALTGGFIWLTIVFGPFALLVGLLLWSGLRLRRRWLGRRRVPEVHAGHNPKHFEQEREQNAPSPHVTG
jgi:hypothetical protein